MVTIPPAGRAAPHEHRRMAESFGVEPARYDRVRAAYPGALIQRIVAAAPGPDFLDVGCGTGIEGRQFRAAGRTVLGVEPDPRMAAFARATGLAVEVATLEAWEPDGRVFDAVVAGTCWHWVDPVAGAAKAGQVLRPGGVLAPFGHVYQLPAPVATALAGAFRRVAPGSPVGIADPAAGSMLDGYRALYDRAADAIRAVGGFGEPEVWRYDWERAYTKDEVLDLIPTSGGMTGLAEDQLAEVLSAVGSAVDELGGALTMRYATWGLTAIRTG